MTSRSQKLYSSDDIDQMREQLSELPDVTQQRLKKNDVLEALKSDINALMNSKGYTINEVLDHLKKFGFSDVTLKDLKEITEGKKSRQRRAGSAIPVNKTPESATNNSTNS
ncbi:TPA: MobC [Klebsiella oxytoca]